MKIRPRRLRKNASIRRLVSQVHVDERDLIMPFFIVEGKGVKNEICSMPGIYQMSIDQFVLALEDVVAAGILGVMLFGIPNTKDACGTQAYAEDGIVQRAIMAAKPMFDQLLFIADVCLCEYTSHGHCGVIKDDVVLNDQTLPLLAKTAVSLAKAGADIVAPSDMMDGRILHIRNALDLAGYDMTPIMAYSVKYASGLYGPFRDAADSAPAFGDRKSYQMDFSNVEESLKVVDIDICSGADFVIVKPASFYLDIINRVSKNVNIPIVAYDVSGEYAMVKAASEKGWLDEKKVVFEKLTAIKRAGASIIISYHALDYIAWKKEGAYDVF